jgi:sulfatase maturation enzyme AslB (radical SAM superfamily)
MGGEPLYSDQNVECLRYLIDNHPNCKQLKIRYSSNGSIYPSDEVQALWKKFKRVVLNFSLDGVGERFDYLRWPLKWYRVERTIDQLIKNTDITVNIFSTINPLNVLYFNEIDTWAKETIPADRFLHPDRPVKHNRCFNPLDLEHAPEELREAVRNRYGEDHFVSKQFNTLEYRDDTQTFFDYVNKHDAIRRLDWRKTFPDVVEYFPNFA